MFDSDSIMICSTKITSIKNTLKTIYLSGNLWDEFKYTYYNDKNNPFEILFQKYTASAVNKIYHPSIVEFWKSNTDKAAYQDKIRKGV